MKSLKPTSYILNSGITKGCKTDAYTHTKVHFVRSEKTIKVVGLKIRRRFSKINMVLHVFLPAFVFAPESNPESSEIKEDRKFGVFNNKCLLNQWLNENL